MGPRSFRRVFSTRRWPPDAQRPKQTDVQDKILNLLRVLPYMGRRAVTGQASSKKLAAWPPSGRKGIIFDSGRVSSFCCIESFRWGPVRLDAAERRSSSSSAVHEHNVSIAAALKAKTEGMSKGIWEASRKAARHIERWPTPIKTLQQCFGVPGVSIYIAKIVVTEILSRDLTGDERAYLAGAEAQMARLVRQA